MLSGHCPHCNSANQRYYETDKRAKHRALTCLTCGYITAYIGFDGTVQDPLPFVSESTLEVTALPQTYDHPTERVRI